MPRKLLKSKPRKIVAKSATTKKQGSIVVIGNYKERQLAWIEKNGVYNWPVREEDDGHELVNVKELWLYANVKSERHVFAAQFVGKMTNAEFLAAYPSYAKLGPSKQKAYYVFKTTPVDYPPELGSQIVLARTADFGKRCAKVKKAIEQFKQDGEFAPLAAYLPKELATVPRPQLRVCEAAVQMELFPIIGLPVFAPVKSERKTGCYRIASLFAGCGGMDLGFVGGFDFLGNKFAQTGFEVVWANELNPAACRTYARNLGDHVICGDIKNVINTIPTDIDVVMGGFPCQDISINGKMLGINGKRSCLYTYIVDAVRRLRPKAFVAENVGSLLLKQNEYSFKTILADFESLGYDVTYHVYHAEEYGVPQTRERIIFVGTRPDVGRFEVPRVLAGNPITAGEAMRDLENRGKDKAFSHVWSEAAPSGEQGSRRMVENRPGYTIRAECHGNIQFHYRLPRRISMREAARIQSFPDSFLFPCGIRETERQIGNAVPPVLAWHIANSLRKALEDSHDKG